MKIAATFFLLLTFALSAFGQFNGTNLFTQTASVTVGNTTTETTVVGAGAGSVTFPASFFYVGRNVTVSIRGYYSTQAILPGTLTAKVKLGSTVIGSAVGNSLVGAISNNGFVLTYTFACRTAGASGTVMGQGDFRYEVLTGSLLSSSLVNTAATTIDTTVSQALNITLQWGTANSANTATITNLTIQAWN